jgi:hypothetical protein
MPRNGCSMERMNDTATAQRPAASKAVSETYHHAA